MRELRTILVGATAATIVAGAVAAQGDIAPPVMARHAQMDLMQYNLNIVGGMAQGKIAYDAAAAKAAAGNLAAYAGTDWHAYFPAGSEAGAMAGSRALPAIWQDLADFDAKHQALAEATAAMAASAGDGAEALKASLGAVGGACGGCHKAYRQSN